MAFNRRFRSRMQGRAAVRARKRSSRKRRYNPKKRIGEPMRKGTSKRTAINRDVCTPINTNTLYKINLTNIGTRGDAINARERGIINLSGWKIRGEFKNNFEGPLYLNIAVISKKNKTGQPDESNFFRGDEGERAIDFNGTGSALHKHRANINSDNWNVVMHQRFRLAGERDSSPGNSVQYSSGKASYMNYTRWLGMRRQFRFDSNTDTEAETDVFLVYWCSSFCGSGSTVSTGALDHNFDIVAYFKEPTCC